MITAIFSAIKGPMLFALGGRSGESGKLRVILGRDSMRSLFSFSPLPFVLSSPPPFSSPVPLIYSSKLVVGS